MTLRTPKITVIGSCLAEISVQCDEEPQSGKIVNGSSFVCKTAGAGVMQATEAAHCGCQSAVISSVGQDCLGEMIEENLNKFGVNTECLIKSQARNTGTIMTMVDKIGHNISCISRGANNSLTKEHIESAVVEQLICQSDCLLLNGCMNSDVLMSAIKLAQMYKIKTILSVDMSIRQISEQISTLPKEFLAVSVLVSNPVNEITSENFTGYMHESKLAAADLVAGGIGAVVIRTSKKGCCIVSSSGTEQINNFTCEKVIFSDGKDAFLGALSACIAVGDDINRAVNFAMAAEILANKKMPSQDNLPKKTEILELLQQS